FGVSGDTGVERRGTVVGRRASQEARLCGRGSSTVRHAMDGANINRRSVLAAVAGLPAIKARREDVGAGGQGIGAVVFDALVLFDFSHVQRAAERLFPGNGADLFRAWKTRQFEYAWLRTITGRYADFWQITRDALPAAAESLNLKLRDDDRDM